MATNTEHYNLVKPDYTDAADVEQLNGNMDIIDDLIWQLANAGGDEEILNLLRQIIALIGETADTGGSTTLGSVFAKINLALNGIAEQKSKLDIVLQILGSGVAEFTSAGSYQVKIPAGITKIKVTACGGGGGGGYVTTGTTACGGGGGGGQAIVNQEYNIENTGSETIINITVGAGGAANADGKPTVVGDFVTLAGGTKGLAVSSSNGTATAGTAGGTGGGNGGTGKSTGTVNKTVTSENGQNGILGTGGKGQSCQSSSEDYPYAAVGGGGGASLGNGGNGAAGTGDREIGIEATAGTRGGGGGGGIHVYTSYGNSNRSAKAGGSGYVKIEWGL